MRAEVNSLMSLRPDEIMSSSIRVRLHSLNRACQRMRRHDRSISARYIMYGDGVTRSLWISRKILSNILQELCCLRSTRTLSSRCVMEADIHPRLHPRLLR